MKNGGIENAKKALIKKLKTKGPISFYEFMKELLYGEFGYYTKFVSFGKKGDFITSPTVGDIFGRTVFNAVREMLSITGSSTLVEVGAGEGSFVKSIIKKAEETSYPIEYIAIEKSAKLRENLKNLRIEVFEDISELPDNNIKGVIFLNELLDAFPVYIIESYDNKLYEIFIDVSNDELVEVKFPIENSEIIRYIEELNITLDDGFRLEVNLDAVKFLSECYRVLNKGFVIIIDYGYVQSEILSPYRMGKTLRGFKKHKIYTYEEILKDPIGVDITHSVNFSAISHFARKIGFKLEGFTSQAMFLLESRILEEVRDRQDIEALKILTLPEGNGMGEIFKVMVLSKNIESCELSFLRNSPQRPSFRLV